MAPDAQLAAADSHHRFVAAQPSGNLAVRGRTKQLVFNRRPLPVFQSFRDEAKAGAPMFDCVHGFSEQQRNLFVWTFAQQLVVHGSPRSGLAVHDRNPQFNAPYPHGNQRASQSLGQLTVGHGSQEFVLGFSPCLVPGMEGRDSKPPAARAYRNLWPTKLPSKVRVSHFAQQGVFFVRPRAITPFGLRNSVMMAALLNGHQRATEPAGKIFIPHRSERLVFFLRPTAQMGIELRDPQPEPLSHHGSFRPSQLQSNILVVRLAEQLDVRR
jgi:hypothetical protein